MEASKDLFAERRRLERVWKRILPEAYACGRCKRSWEVTEEHLTPYQVELGKGVYVLCEACWQALTPEERLPYYKDLFMRWQEAAPVDPDEWIQIKQSVLAGK